MIGIWWYSCASANSQWESSCLRLVGSEIIEDCDKVEFIQLEAPQGGSTAAPLFILGLLVDGLKANELPS